MKNQINYQGLIIDTDCKYLFIHESESISFREDKKKSVLEITYIPGSTSDSISGILGIPRLGKSMVISGMSRPEKFIRTTIKLNGLEFQKMTYDQHILKVVIVNDSESRVIQSYHYTTLVISDKDYKDQDFIDFILYSGNLRYIIPVTPKKCRSESWYFKNFPRIIINKKSLDLESKSETIFSLRSKYDNYKIRAIDYQNQFIEELRKRLGDYGIELCRQNREVTLTKTSYISYRFSQTPTNSNHPMYSDQHNQLVSHKLPVEFELHCDNTQLFFDFKTKYNNVDLVSNFCEMTTLDKYGELWTSAIKWGRLSEDFSQLYESDSNSNFSLSCQFSCELYFYEVYDTSHEFIKEINYELLDALNEDDDIETGKL